MNHSLEVRLLPLQPAEMPIPGNQRPGLYFWVNVVYKKGHELHGLFYLPAIVPFLFKI